MDHTLQKTFTFILFIFIGLLLKTKFKGKEEITGIKKIILNLTLPATIFIALLGIEIEAGLLLLPVLAILLNIVFFLFFPVLLPTLGIQKNTPRYRTAKLLIPSLAPGLSCFPFVAEFLGEAYLAKAAMADLGNKVFVLVVLYVVAMNWHYKVQVKEVLSQTAKIKSLLLAMVSEPVNLFILAALLLVFAGINMQSMPIIINNTMERLSFLMTPLVLLFIGLAVKIKKNQLGQIMGMLLLRAGFVVVVSAVLVLSAGVNVQEDILLLLAFALSACSFWPFAHISAVDSQEKEVAEEKKTFNGNFAVNILALSFPLSTSLILVILSAGSTFSSVLSLFILGAALILAGFIPVAIARLRSPVIPEKAEKPVSLKKEYQISGSESS